LIKAGLYTQTDLTEPLYQEFADGEVVFFTTRSPDKETVNEDCLALFQVDQNTGVLAIADGLGGQPGGETASKTAIRCLQKAIDSSQETHLSLRDAILDGVENANRTIINQSTGSGTTLAIAEIHANKIRPYHVGDSMIMITGQRAKTKLQSVAHSPIGYAVESGLLDADEAIHHEERHLISNLVGSAEMRIEIGTELKMAKRDTLIISSDGLFDNLYLDEITDIIRKGPLMKAANNLVTLAQQRMLDENSPDTPSHPDDLTFILYRSL
jgi:serine/threonine protein phosphatase PrpC